MQSLERSPWTPLRLALVVVAVAFLMVSVLTGSASAAAAGAVAAIAAQRLGRTGPRSTRSSGRQVQEKRTAGGGKRG